MSEKSFWGTPWLKRVAIGKTLGSIYGLTLFFLCYTSTHEAGPLFCFGMLLSGVYLGAIIALLGPMYTAYDKGPLNLHIKLPWWIRGSLMGAVWGLFIILLVHDDLKSVIVNSEFALIPDFVREVSPWLYIVHAGIAGLIIDGITTFFVGEKE